MLTFFIPKNHVWRHFPGSDETGSVFYAKTPIEVLTFAATNFPQVFKDAQTDPKDGRKRLSFVSDNEIGLCNVVELKDLTPKERETIIEEDRDGSVVKVVNTARRFPTREFQIILDKDNKVVTMFPGPMAPPLPAKGESSVFWDKHVFIRNI